MIFDYEKFEETLLVEIEKYAKSHVDNKEEFYILSIDYWPFYTTYVQFRGNTYSYLNTKSNPSDKDYMDYKYCEEEWNWDLFQDIEVLSKGLQRYDAELEAIEEDELREEQQTAHASKIISICKSVLKQFKETETYKAFSSLYLNVYVREYFSNEQCVQNFIEINGEACAEEYVTWL